MEKPLIMSEIDEYTKAEKYASAIRAMIQHEDTLINHRLTWFLVFQGFLFTALGIVWQGVFSNGIKPDLFLIGITVMIAIVGSLSALATKQGVNSAVEAILKLHEKWDKYQKQEVIAPVIGLILETEGSEKLKSRKFLTPWKFIPSMMFFWWIVVGLIVIIVY